MANPFGTDNLEDREEQRIQDGIQRYDKALSDIFSQKNKDDWFTKYAFDKKIIDELLSWKKTEQIKPTISEELDTIAAKHPLLFDQPKADKHNFTFDYIKKLKTIVFGYTIPPHKVLQAAQELVEDAENADATTKIDTLQKTGKQLDIFQEELSDTDLKQAEEIANKITKHLYGQTVDEIVGKTNLQILKNFL